MTTLIKNAAGKLLKAEGKLWDQNSVEDCDCPCGVPLDEDDFESDVCYPWDDDEKDIRISADLSGSWTVDFELENEYVKFTGSVTLTCTMSTLWRRWQAFHSGGETGIPDHAEAGKVDSDGIFQISASSLSVTSVHEEITVANANPTVILTGIGFPVTSGHDYSQSGAYNTFLELETSGASPPCLKSTFTLNQSLGDWNEIHFCALDVDFSREIPNVGSWRVYNDIHFLRIHGWLLNASGEWTSVPTDNVVANGGMAAHIGPTWDDLPDATWNYYPDARKALKVNDVSGKGRPSPGNKFPDWDDFTTSDGLSETGSFTATVKNTVI